MVKFFTTAIVGSALAIVAQAAPINIPLDGATSTDIWSNFTTGAISGYPGFPGSSPWPAPIASQSGGGNASLAKTSGAAYIGSVSIYMGGYVPTPNSLGASFSVTDIVTGLDLNTVVFQIEIAGAFGYDFYEPSPGSTAFPALSYNGGTQAISSTYYSVISQIVDGEFENPLTGEMEPIYKTTYGFQWDLSGISDISSLDISFTAVQHSQIYAMRLDESSAIYTSSILPVPEPGTWMLFGLGAAGLIFMHRRRAIRG